jgi:hypothetical protein
MGIPAEKLLEVAVGSPVLVGYLAYVVGLLIVIAAVKVANLTSLQGLTSNTR